MSIPIVVLMAFLRRDVHAFQLRMQNEGTNSQFAWPLSSTNPTSGVYDAESVGDNSLVYPCDPTAFAVVAAAAKCASQYCNALNAYSGGMSLEFSQGLGHQNLSQMTNSPMASAMENFGGNLGEQLPGNLTPAGQPVCQQTAWQTLYSQSPQTLVQPANLQSFLAQSPYPGNATMCMIPVQSYLSLSPAGSAGPMPSILVQSPMLMQSAAGSAQRAPMSIQPGSGQSPLGQPNPAFQRTCQQSPQQQEEISDLQNSQETAVVLAPTAIGVTPQDSNTLQSMSIGGVFGAHQMACANSGNGIANAQPSCLESINQTRQNMADRMSQATSSSGDSRDKQPFPLTSNGAEVATLSRRFDLPCGDDDDDDNDLSQWGCSSVSSSIQSVSKQRSYSGSTQGNYKREPRRRSKNAGSSVADGTEQQKKKLENQLEQAIRDGDIPAVLRSLQEVFSMGKVHEKTIAVLDERANESSLLKNENGRRECLEDHGEANHAVMEKGDEGGHGAVELESVEKTLSPNALPLPAMHSLSERVFADHLDTLLQKPFFAFFDSRSPCKKLALRRIACETTGIQDYLGHDQPDVVFELYRRQFLHIARDAVAKLRLLYGSPIRHMSRKPILFFAAWVGNAEMVKLLLPFGDVFEVERTRFQSTLQFGAYFGHAGVVQVLLDAVDEMDGKFPLFKDSLKDGAEINSKNPRKPLYLEWKDRDGRTALHFAAMSGSSKTIQVLLEHGANPNSRDGLGDFLDQISNLSDHRKRSPVIGSGSAHAIGIVNHGGSASLRCFSSPTIRMDFTKSAREQLRHRSSVSNARSKQPTFFRSQTPLYFLLHHAGGNCRSIEETNKCIDLMLDGVSTNAVDVDDSERKANPFLRDSDNRTPLALLQADIRKELENNGIYKEVGQPVARIPEDEVDYHGKEGDCQGMEYESQEMSEFPDRNCAERRQGDKVVKLRAAQDYFQLRVGSLQDAMRTASGTGTAPGYDAAFLSGLRRKAPHEGGPRQTGNNKIK